MRAAIRTILGFVLLVWGAAVSVQAATYYVAQEAPNASDKNPGTEEAPWKTLTHAAETAAKGDTVYVKAGTYRERLKLEGERVTIQAFGDGRFTEGKDLFYQPQGSPLKEAALSHSH